MINPLKLSIADGRKRNFGLDVVRSSAIGLVLISHGRHLLPDFHGKNLFANGGYFGVELFFVLSGFLVGSILMNIFDERRPTVTGRQIRDFWLRRWFRTLPNYFLFLLLNITLFQWWFGEKDFRPEYWVFLQNFAWPCPNVMPESWSLAIEEWFYFLSPFCLLLFSFWVRDRKRAILLGLLIYIAIFTSLRFLGAFAGDPAWDDGVRKVVIYRLDAIGWGVLIAFLQKYHPGAVEKYERWMLGAGVFMVALSVYVFSVGILTTMETYFNKSFLFTLTNVGLALLLPSLQKLRSPSYFVTYTISHVSMVSYSAYLIHFSLVIPLLARPFFINNLPRVLVYGLYLLITVICATLVYKYFEKPMTTMREYVVGRERGRLGLITVE